MTGFRYIKGLALVTCFISDAVSRILLEQRYRPSRTPLPPALHRYNKSLKISYHISERSGRPTWKKRSISRRSKEEAVEELLFKTGQPSHYLLISD